QAIQQPSPFAGPEDQRLAMWAGAWEETVRFAGDPEDKPSGTGKWMARPFYGLYVVINYELKGPDGNYHAHAVMAFDHGEKTYRLWWFDDGANIDEYTGAWKDDNTLVFELKRTSEGKIFRERLTYTHVSEDEVHTRIEQAFGTEPFKLYLESAAHRVAMAEAQGGQNQQRQQGQQRRRPPGGPQEFRGEHSQPGKNHDPARSGCDQKHHADGQQRETENHFYRSFDPLHGSQSVSGGSGRAHEAAPEDFPIE